MFRGICLERTSRWSLFGDGCVGSNCMDIALVMTLEESVGEDSMD